MKLRVITSYLVITLSTATLVAACNDDSDNTPITTDDVIQALGGIEAIQAADKLRLQVTGNFFEMHQEGPEFDMFDNIPATFSYEQNAEFNAEQLHLVWDQQFIFPFQYQGESTTVIANGIGYIEGVQGFGSRYFGFSAPAPLHSSRVQAIYKTQKLANPLALLLEIAATGSSELVLSQGENLPSIEIEVDPETNLPLLARVKEHDALLGDVNFEVMYANWQVLDNTLYPSFITHRLDNEVIRIEQITSIETVAEWPEEHFTIPVDTTIDVRQSRLGVLSSQWYNRMFSFGFSHDMPLDMVSVEPLSEHIYILKGQAGTFYSSVVVESEEGLTIIEPSLNAHRSLAVIEALTAYFGNTPKIATIATHAHMDHFGGVRAMAAETGRLYIGADSVPFVQEVFGRQSTLINDRLNSVMPVQIEAIAERTAISQGGSEIELIPIETDHDDAMLIIYLPAIKSLFIADLFNGGFAAGLDFYTPETAQVMIERARRIQRVITEENLDVEFLIAVHSASSDRVPVSELEVFTNFD